MSIDGEDDLRMVRRGRPSLYTPEFGEAVCSRIAQGQSLMRVCGDPNMPGYSTVCR